MKYLVLIGDGMADFPLEELGGKTPLMAARKPHMDRMATRGVCGKVVTVPEGFAPGSDVAGMSLFGYDPARYYTGRAPIEAYGMGIPMGGDDVAFRCNLVHLRRGGEGDVMADYSGGHISTEEARLLIDGLQGHVGADDLRFFPGVGYRHIVIWQNGLWQMTTTPPHDITDQEISSYLPQGEGSQRIRNLMAMSRDFLSRHPVNLQRTGEGKLPANSIWLWGQGKRADFPPFCERYGLSGATVAAVDLIKGISKLVGFDAPLVEGATGYLDTNYRGKAEKALDLLKNHDIVFVHVEAPDEASHNGSLEEKIRAIEMIDGEVVKRILQTVKEETRILLVTDHATPLVMRTHYATPVPFAVYQQGQEIEGHNAGYDENIEGPHVTGEELMEFFVRGQNL